LKIFPIQPSAESGSLVRRVLLANLDALHSTALRVSGSADTAEDVVQETAKKALKAIAPVGDERAARRWLFRILLNNLRDHFRRRLAEAPQPAATDIETPPDPEALMRAAFHDVNCALHRLRPAARAVILLIDVEGFTLAEAADMLRIPIGTAASRLARARAELRRFLSAYDTRSPGIGGPA
jgi:RNA polymerase sigma-70 factor, ECF subfamily